MTAVLSWEFDRALEAARQQLAEPDVHRDQRDKHRRVQHLTAVGGSAEEIAETVGYSERHVVRLRSKPLAAEPAPLPDPASVPDQRCAELEALAWTAFEWAGQLRDEDPRIVYYALATLPRERLVELVVVALAMVPSEATLREALAWVIEIGDRA